MCDGGWEWWAGGMWIRECDVSRVFCARLAEWDRKLIPEMRWWTAKWAIGDSRLNRHQAVQIKKEKNHKQILTWTFVLLSFTPVLRNESSRERKVQGAKVPGCEISKERKFQGAKAPRNESSRERKFHTWNFRSRERMVLGAKSPVTTQRTTRQSVWLARGKKLIAYSYPRF